MFGQNSILDHQDAKGIHVKAAQSYFRLYLY